MQSFFNISFILLMLVSVTINFFLYKTVKMLEKSIHIVNVRSSNLLDEIESVRAESNRSLLELRSILEPAKPMKTNNWDSVRKAFERPRIDVNERT